jgi:hypothetical protein
MARPWLRSTRTRDIKLAQFEPQYRQFAARLAAAIEASDRMEVARRATGAERQAIYDTMLRAAWGDLLGDYKSWLQNLGLTPKGPRGLTSDVAEFLRAEAQGPNAFQAAPMVLAVLAVDPASEVGDLIGNLIVRPPGGSTAVQAFALDAVGQTNRPDYLPLLESVHGRPARTPAWPCARRG